MRERWPQSTDHRETVSCFNSRLKLCRLAFFADARFEAGKFQLMEDGILIAYTEGITETVLEIGRGMSLSVMDRNTRLLF
jgi:hypothetical protein